VRRARETTSLKLSKLRLGIPLSMTRAWTRYPSYMDGNFTKKTMEESERDGWYLWVRGRFSCSCEVTTEQMNLRGGGITMNLGRR
jgi:hypothetical protein